MVIIRPDLGDQEREEIFTKIIKKIEGLGGQASASKVWAKERNFYYFLKEKGTQNKHYRGCYWLIDFTLDRDKISDLKEAIRLEERILRSLIINLEARARLKPDKRVKPRGSSRARTGG